MPKFDKARHEESMNKMFDTFRPYLGRVVAEWHDKKSHDSMYVWLVCSRQEDAGEGRHQWRGVVAVRIMGDGATFFYPGEELVMKKIGIGGGPSTWAKTEQMLTALVPDLPEAAQAG